MIRPAALPDPSCPPHYRGDGRTTCADALASMMTGAKVSPTAAYWWGCAFKYLWRWHLKAGMSDLEKCRDCVERLMTLQGRDGSGAR